MVVKASAIFTGFIAISGLSSAFGNVRVPAVDQTVDHDGRHMDTVLGIFLRQHLLNVRIMARG